MKSFERISCLQAQTKMQDEDAVLVDIRDPNAFEAAHVDGATRLSNENLQQFLQQADHDKPLLVMCYHGHSSQQAAQFLAQQGFEQVFSVDGGFEAWRKQLPFVGR